MHIEAIKSRGALVWRFTLLALTIGVAVGLLIHFISGAPGGEAASKAVNARTRKAPEEWYLWLGGARASEESFASSSECEEYRRRAFLEVQASAEEAMDQLGDVSIEQIQMLGFDPRERVEAQVIEAGKAICRGDPD